MKLRSIVIKFQLAIVVVMVGIIPLDGGVRSQTLDQQFFDQDANQDTHSNLQSEADRLLQLGDEQAETGQVQAAIDLWLEALNHYQSLGENQGIGEVYNRLSLTYINLGQFTAAEEATRRWLAIARDDRNTQVELYAVNRLGAIILERGQVSAAQVLFQEGLDIALTIDDSEGRGLSLSNLGLIAATTRDYATAIRRYEQALPYLNFANNQTYRVTTLNRLGDAYAAAERPDDAFRNYLAAYRAATEIGDRSNRYHAIDRLVAYYRLRQRWLQAYELLEVRFQMAQSDGDLQQQLISARTLAEFYVQTGDRSLAQDFYEQAITLARQLQDIREETRLINELAALGTVEP